MVIIRLHFSAHPSTSGHVGFCGEQVPKGQTLAGETILIIDDNADVRNLLAERVLPSYGYRTLTAPDGQEGLWQIRTQMPDLILLDLRLPDMTGLDLLHILSSEGYDAPVILITAYGSELIAAQALRLGVRDYIIKPFTLDEIIESVERALTEQRLRRERNALTDHVQYCTYALQLLAQVKAEMAEQPDTGLRLRRLLEMAVAAARARSGQLWLREPLREPLKESLREPRAGELILRAAQDRPDQRAYLLYRREEARHIQEALSSDNLLQWPEEEEAGQLQVAIPIMVNESPSAVLELRLSKEAALPEGPGLPILRAFADHIGLVLEQAALAGEALLLRRQIGALGTLSRDLLLVLDEEDTITAVSPAIETMLGQRPQDVVGQKLKQWAQAVESSQGDLAEWYMQQVAAQRPGEQYALLFQGRDGTARMAEVQIMLGQEERVTWRYMLIHDTTAYHRLEQEVRSLRRDLSDLVRGAHLGLFLTDLKGTVLAVNGALTELLHSPQEELLGRPIWDAFAATDAGHLVPEEIARAYREGKGHAEVRLSDQEGGVLGITPLLLLGAEGVPHAIVVLAGQSQPTAGKPEDESDVLGRPGVDSNTRH